MPTQLISFPENASLTRSLVEHTGFSLGEIQIRRFPDGESFVKVLSEVKDIRVIVVCTLDRPDEKFLPLYFLFRT